MGKLIKFLIRFEAVMGKATSNLVYATVAGLTYWMNINLTIAGQASVLLSVFGFIMLFFREQAEPEKPPGAHSGIGPALVTLNFAYILILGSSREPVGLLFGSPLVMLLAHWFYYKSLERVHRRYDPDVPPVPSERGK